MAMRLAYKCKHVNKKIKNICIKYGHIENQKNHCNPFSERLTAFFSKEDEIKNVIQIKTAWFICQNVLMLSFILIRNR